MYIFDGDSLGGGIWTIIYITISSIVHYSGGTSVDSIVNKVDTIVNHADEFISTGLEMNKRLAGYDWKKFIQLGKKKNIVIVGGGVAGMEAAHVVMLRGHDVTIYEKSDIFGWNLIPTDTRDFKYEVGEWL